MSKLVAAESNSPKKATKKTLDHLELHPRLGGGHIVKHVYSSYEHEPMEVQFNKDGKGKGGESISAHLQRHAGLPGLLSYDKGDASETEAAIGMKARKV